MQYKRDAAGTIRTFDSVPEMARYIENTPAKWRIKDSENAPASRKWCLNTPYAAAWKLAKSGWLEGAKTARKALKAFNPRDTRPDSKVDFYGHMPHVARYCAGAPDSMIRHAREGETGGGKVLTLYVSIVASCSQRAECMSNYGLAMAQYINQMEADGTRIELWAGFITSLSGKRHSFAFRVKRADQALDLAILAYAVGHPTMFRRLGFALIERSEGQECSSYGSPRALTADDIINPVSGAVYLNGMQQANQCAATPVAALEHLTNAIEAARE